MTILVFGSINMDLVARTPTLPMPGETLTGRSFETISGGKGANQAVAAARLGAKTDLIGRVGQDGFGQALLGYLNADGVGCDRILVDDSTHSGVAMIAVDDRGENHIIVIPGANGRVDSADVHRLLPLLPNATAVLMQLEIPLAAVVEAAQAARAAGVPVILDPAPARSDLPAELYPLIDILTPNQVEASQLTGLDVHDWQSAAQAGDRLRQRGVKTVIVKLGAQGVFCISESEQFSVPAFPVTAIDTVAAGDAFNGGLAVALAEGRSLRQAIYRAAAVAALSVTKAGAQSSLPTQTELSAFLAMVGDE